MKMVFDKIDGEYVSMSPDEMLLDPLHMAMNTDEDPNCARGAARWCPARSPERAARRPAVPPVRTIVLDR